MSPSDSPHVGQNVCCLCELPMDEFPEGVHAFEDAQTAHLRCWQNGPALDHRRDLREMRESKRRLQESRRRAKVGPRKHYG